jgi:hypothetical protein
MDVVRKLVSGRLQAQAAGPHPDPELLAALAEGSAGELERQNLFNHLATCTDCREVFYLTAPELTEPQQVLANPIRRPRFAVRWATLAASVIVVGGVLLTNPQLFNRHSSPSMQPSAPAAIVRDENAPSKSLDKLQSAQNAAPRVFSKARPAAKHMTAKPQATMRFDNSGEVHFAARSADQVQQPAQGNAVGAIGPEARAKAAEESSKVSPIAGVPSSWRLSAQGMPQHSLDGGQTWRDVSVENGLVFGTITSIGREVWAGGKNGAFYHSSDAGQNWAKVEPNSAGKKLEADITQIRFTDAADGIVNTANGEVWSTSDAGQTWRVK